MSSENKLPPGQKETSIFPRFGLRQYANRFPKEVDKLRILVGGDFPAFEITNEMTSRPRVSQMSDFHCVTTWSKLNLTWRGFKFRDFYSTFILPKVSCDITFVVLKAQDGCKTTYH